MFRGLLRAVGVSGIERRAYAAPFDRVKHPEAWAWGLQRRERRYKFHIDGTRWLTDPANPARENDALGGWNSLFWVA